MSSIKKRATPLCKGKMIRARVFGSVINSLPAPHTRDWCWTEEALPLEYKKDGPLTVTKVYIVDHAQDNYITQWLYCSDCIEDILVEEGLLW